MSERTLLILSRYNELWKNVLPFLSGMKVALGREAVDPPIGFAVLGHGERGHAAQTLALDEGARALVLMSCDLLRGRERELAGLEIPVLLLWGEDDTVHPIEEAWVLNELMPTSTLALVPGCGHELPLQAPDIVGPIIADYLRSKWMGLDHDHGGPTVIELSRPPDKV